MELKEFDFKNIKVKTGIHESDFMKNFLQNEFLDSIQSKDIQESNLYIHNSYAYEGEDYIELGTYIINTSNNNILLKSLPLGIINGENKINKILDIDRQIDKNSTIFTELKIEKELLEKPYDLNDFKIIINNLNSLERYEQVKIDLNIEPKFKKYISKREFNKFIKNLPKINENSLAINVFKRAYVEDGYFISLVFRNSSANDININTLPIVVTTSNDLIIYEGVMEFEADNCFIPNNKAVLKNILIPLENFPKLPNYDGMDFKILFKNL